MSRLPREYLRHILDETRYLMGQSEGLTKTQLIQDETLRRAFVRSLEIIGEASKQLPDDFKREHSHIEWRAIAGMRDHLIHRYFGIDYDIVWDAVLYKVPALYQEIERILHNTTDSDE